LLRSKPGFNPATFCQSVVPNVVGFVSRLPSPPANVLPLSGGRQDCVVPVAAKSQPLALSARLIAGTPIVMSVAAPISAPHVNLLLRNRLDLRPGFIAPFLRISGTLIFRSPRERLERRDLIFRARLTHQMCPGTAQVTARRLI